MSDSGGFVALPSNTEWTAAPQWFPQRPAWMADAECLGVDPDVFFPERGEDVRIAKEICRQCPVRAECLDYGLEYGGHYGIWGGTSERERRSMRRRRGIREEAS